MDYGFVEKALKRWPNVSEFAPISKKCHNYNILRQLHGETLPLMENITYIILRDKINLNEKTGEQ